MSFFLEDPDRIPVIVDALRTPIGRYGGALKDVRPDDLAAVVLRSLIERHAVDPARVDEVILGCANQAGEDNRNVARMASLLAGLPDTVPGLTVNRLCASSLSAIALAAYQIRCGEADCIIAGGVESMSRAPYAIPKNTSDTLPFGNLTAYDTALGWRFPNPKLAALYPLEAMGETAENIHERTGITREDQDAFALESHARAVRAREEGIFDGEIIPVTIEKKKSSLVVARDEQPRADTSLEKLATLPPAFRKGGTVTAGNSSSLNDGAAALLMMSARAAREAGLRPMARFVSSGTAGVDPRVMGLGPIDASQLALRRAGLVVDDIAIVELNEAFAVQALAVISALGLDPARVNPNGGAIALGHPLGCSGARIATTLLHEMRGTSGPKSRSPYGLATMCVGVGQGVAVVFEVLT
ncbi:MAG: thiolase family protein [Ignavibacteriae bacterium]|nr:thiolase family protein [Ignavibacteriota bacterium]